MNEFSNPEDDQIRRMFNDAVSDIEPDDALGSLQSRTAGASSRRPWLWGAGAAALVGAATIAAVSIWGGGPGTTNATDPVDPAGASSASPSPTPTTSEPTPSQSSSPTTSQSMSVPVYYVGDTTRGPRLFREFHSVAVPNAPGPGKINAALHEAVSDSTLDPDYRSLWPEGTAATIGHDRLAPDGSWPVTLENSSTDLSKRPGDMSAAEAKAAVQQLVYTVQAVTKDEQRSPVRFTLEPEPAGGTTTLLGVPVGEPVAAGKASAVLAQVWIIDPAQGARLDVPFKVSGLANAFEANVQWELMAEDKVVKKGFTTATEAMTMAPYSFTVKNVAPGDYTLVVHDSDASGGAEGGGVWTDTKQITVTGPSSSQPLWRATDASLKRDMPKALGCDRVIPGEAAWVCNGSTKGKAAAAYWIDNSGISFGDPKRLDHVYPYTNGTTQPASPSQAWQAIAPYVVPGATATATRITRWLRSHHRARTMIDGLTVEIDGPVGGVANR